MSCALSVAAQEQDQSMPLLQDAVRRAPETPSLRSTVPQSVAQPLDSPTVPQGHVPVQTLVRLVAQLCSIFLQSLRYVLAPLPRTATTLPLSVCVCLWKLDKPLCDEDPLRWSCVDPASSFSGCRIIFSHFLSFSFGFSFFLAETFVHRNPLLACKIVSKCLFIFVLLWT